jgi:hypothetical protein
MISTMAEQTTESGVGFEYPDITNLDELTAAVAAIEVLGGLSRSGHVNAEGDFVPDRHIEPLGDFVSLHSLRWALDHALHRTHYINGVDGVITGQSLDAITILYTDGTQRTFEATATVQESATATVPLVPGRLQGA